MGQEPAALVRGKAFHQRVQADWELDADGTVRPELTIPLLARSGTSRVRKGRMDIFVDDIETYVVIVEIKSTNWDLIPRRNRRRNLARHRRQVWKYVDQYLASGTEDIVAGIIYPASPADAAVRSEIEDYLNDWAIQVVWYDDAPVSA